MDYSGVFQSIVSTAIIAVAAALIRVLLTTGKKIDNLDARFAQWTITVEKAIAQTEGKVEKMSSRVENHETRLVVIEFASTLKPPILHRIDPNAVRDSESA